MVLAQRLATPVLNIAWPLACLDPLSRRLHRLAAAADEPVLVRVNTFPNAKALPFHAGIAKGIFAQARHPGSSSHFTDNSRNQREGLASGKFDVAQSALDNAVAMIEVAQQDVIIVGGGDSGMNEFFVQAEITSFADLRGRILIVDAPDTAYALQAKKILLQHGLKEGADYTVKPVGAGVFRFKAMAESKDNAAAILNLPFTVQAEQLGHAQPRPHRRHARPLPGGRRVRDARLGGAERRDAGALPRRLRRVAALGARSGEPGRDGRPAGREAQAAADGGGADL